MRTKMICSGKIEILSSIKTVCSFYLVPSLSAAPLLPGLHHLPVFMSFRPPVPPTTPPSPQRNHSKNTTGGIGWSMLCMVSVVAREHLRDPVRSAASLGW
jgi:hypothetical protein